MVIFTGASVEEAIQNGLKTLDIPRMRAHITVVSREKKGFLGLFGKKPAQVDVEPIAETTVAKANQQAVKGVPEEINAQNEPVQSVSEATVDLGLSLIHICSDADRILFRSLGDGVGSQCPLSRCVARGQAR